MKLDLSKWHDKPDEQTFKDWQAVRKAKRMATTQTAINRAAVQINKLHAMGISADEAIGICCERAWAGIKAEWVLNHIRENQGQGGMQANVVPMRQTRQISLEEELNDTSWAE